ncbi:glycosyl hydrolase family 18 (putative chitinase) [Stella humosa]|uniref:Glycosyl hydrolase family 18 (Putative chitinase) n=1 Tax=Stella humosa TaxID=94 RepID=A0A3N1MJ39_9PROT|nr:glycosyl hydrolase family 18 protein [Stella humosa]ROQ03349.1 glycosyl hydrolase family 18 (putative chitinase) [Stella humosa]BBK29636.1 hypothetical protein STHU_02700 [Stella humosa]
MRRLGWVAAVLWLLAQATAASAADRPILAYLASWYEPPAARAADTRIARLPRYVDILALSFARPDPIYPPGGELTGSGLQFQFPAAVLREAIALRKARNPGARVLISVGGSTYRRWDRYDEAAIARLVRDLGADGVDLDYEPSDPQCENTGGTVRCRSDAVWIDLVRRTRQVLPRPYMLAVAGWSVGAYGEGAWRMAPPRSPWTGSMLGLLRAPEAGQIDLVSIMGYDAGPSYDPLEGFRAYRNYWRGTLALGIQVLPPDSPGAGAPGADVPGQRFTVQRTGRLLAGIAADPAAAAMLYGFGLTPTGAIGPDNPDAGLLARTICTGFARKGCERPVP